MYSYAIPVKSLLYANYPPLLSLPADPEEGVSPSVQKAFASMMEEGTETEQTEEEEEEDDEDDDYEEEEEEDSEEERKVEAKEDEEGPSAGDVFALEMELNRENKKMMKVKMR